MMQNRKKCVEILQDMTTASPEEAEEFVDQVIDGAIVRLRTASSEDGAEIYGGIITTAPWLREAMEEDLRMRKLL